MEHHTVFCAVTLGISNLPKMAPKRKEAVAKNRNEAPPPKLDEKKIEMRKHHMYCQNKVHLQQWIQNFPREGANSPGGCQHMILPNFPENCMKSKEFGHPGGVCPLHPSKSATDLVGWQYSNHWQNQQRRRTKNMMKWKPTTKV